MPQQSRIGAELAAVRSRAVGSAVRATQPPEIYHLRRPPTDAPRCPGQPTISRSEKKNLISIAAFSSDSEPCTELSPIESANSLRIVPASASAGLVAPMTVRFAVKSNKEAVITVPEGVTKGDLKEARLPWADLTYPFAGAPQASGAAVFIHPQHPDYPPTWLTRHYGPLCVGWPGVKSKTFQPGEPIRTRYRIWIHDKPVSVDDLTRAYAGYQATAEVAWE